MKNLGLVEGRFCDLVWANAPVTTAQLVKLCEKELNWKRTTTYTVLKKLCEKGIFSNDNSVVTVKISRDDFFSLQSEQFIEETFDGSLPAFIAAFTRKKDLSEAEIKEIRRLIDEFGKE